MSKRRTQNMLRLMASGEPVEVTSPMASVKTLARLAFIAQQFGYEYADVRQGGYNNSSLVMLIVPDPSPQARARAAQNWAQYPNAGDGVSLPPVVPDALELLKARINFDLTGKSAEKRMLFGAIGTTAGAVAVALKTGGDGLFWGALFWAFLMSILAVGFVVNRRRNARFAARLQAAGFVQVTDETGRLRYLPPGGQLPGHGNPFAQQQPGHGNPFAQQQPYPQQQYGQQQPQYGGQQPPFPQQQPQYGGQQPPFPQQQPQYGQAPQPSYGQQTPYGQQPPYPRPQQPQMPAPAAAPAYPQYPQQAPPPQPYAQPRYGGQPQPQPPQQNPHWQPPQG
ncbi:hypothetical protein [Streptomyces thermocarboxydovorans]